MQGKMRLTSPPCSPNSPTVGVLAFFTRKGGETRFSPAVRGVRVVSRCGLQNVVSRPCGLQTVWSPDRVVSRPCGLPTVWSPDRGLPTVWSPCRGLLTVSISLPFHRSITSSLYLSTSRSISLSLDLSISLSIRLRLSFSLSLSLPLSIRLSLSLSTFLSLSLSRQQRGCLVWSPNLVSRAVVSQWC